MKLSGVLLLAALALPGPCSAEGSAETGRAAAATSPDGWTLVWADEFDGSGLDRGKWSFDEDCWGGGNDERQCYTSSSRNAAVEKGHLVITARKERVSGPALPKAQRRTAAMPDAQATRAFSSARLTTRGKSAWRFGRIEVRARLPQGQGTWPAIWMLPEDDRYGSWAASGEIDILEAVNLGVACPQCPGGAENTILGTLHFGGQWPANRQAGSEFAYPPVLTDDFHIYTLEWFPDHMVWKVNGQVFAERHAREWSTTGSAEPGAPFDQPFHLVLNLAIGGRLPEGRGVGGVDSTGYPKQMEIDWVRVWQQPEGPRVPAAAAPVQGSGAQ
jgi:beta-glucanase (GH16 family)